MKRRFARIVVFTIANVMAWGGLTLWSDHQARADERTAQLSLPQGFSLSVYALAPGARSMALAEQLGVLFVSTRGDTVYAIPLGDDDGLRPTYPVLTGLHVANGIAWKDGYLYVAEQHRLTRYRVSSLDALNGTQPEVLYARLPDKSGHGWRYISFGADGALYMGIGAPCNVCTPQGLEGTITRFAAPRFDTPEIVARGVRNSVGSDTQPGTGVLHFTDNGADGLGDDSPPDELNALIPGQHYGYPWFGGGQDRTPQMKLVPPPVSTFPVVAFQAHSANLGVDFYTGRQFPDEYVGDAFVAQHGSWNRSSKVGYQVVRVRFDGAGRAISHAPFISGWLRDDQTVIGRPVDVEELPDGSLLISDDAAGRIYRVVYSAASQ